MKPLLEARHITKRFAGVTALSDVSMQLYPGRVTALIGENGAGKSTLLKIMSGIHTDYDGDILYKDEKIQFHNPKHAQDSGIAIIHQELNLIPHLSIMENIFLGRELTNRFGLLDTDRMLSRTKELLHQLSVDVDPKVAISSIKVGQQQIVEIAKALLSESEVVFMDEPTSAIGDSEVEMLFDIIRRLKVEGKSIVYISHKLEELYAIADDFVVLRDGQLVGHGAVEDINRDELVKMMAGRNVSHGVRASRDIKMDNILSVQGLRLDNPSNPERPILQDITFDHYKGEVLGFYGLMGAGRTELCECLFGVNTNWTGQIMLDGEKVHFKSPIAAIKAGVALVPEDRKQDGIIAGLSVVKNMSLPVLDQLTKWGWLQPDKESSIYQKHVSALKIKVNSPKQFIKNLSGGNQQKVVLAKWIESNPKVLILDEPTRGIDINAKNEIYTLIQQLADAGISILVISSEIPEILSIADRIIVMSEGRISATFSAKEATDTLLMNACIAENITA